MITKIAITYNMIEEWQDSLYYNLCLIRNFGEDQYWEVGQYCHYYLNTPSRRIAATTLHCSYKTSYKITLPLKGHIKLEDNFIALMPLETFDLLIKTIRESGTSSPSSWLKLYLYMYLHIMQSSNNGWSHSIEQIQGDLKIQHSDMAERLRTFERAGLLIRGTYYPNQLARIYNIPEIHKTEERIFEENYKK